MQLHTRMTLVPVTICLVLAILLSLPASAQAPLAPSSAPPSHSTDATAGTVEEAAWQAVVGAQIAAFRDRDAEAAFGYAGAAFQQTYPSADLFFVVIMGSGYAPIMDSRSHSFGRFVKTSETEVVQEVQLVAPDRSIFTAAYQLKLEEAGWRVQGVALRREASLAI
ncbi:MAG: DUF4864 domain-containing protein [Devosia sp.]